jgi:CubicO group peptidase (beta-lactamase class C family)
MEKSKVPGLSVGIVNHGQMALVKGFGFADLENSVPASGETVYRIASISKSITATAAMKLVEKGKLDFDAPVQKYCSDFPEKPWIITVRHLLSHQSGIRNYLSFAETLNTRHYASLREALQQFAGDPLEFQPGTRMSYSSYGYVLLGCVLEGSSGMNFESTMRQSVFEPAGMTKTRLDDVFTIVPHRARGYVLDRRDSLKNAEFVDLSNKLPASGVISTASDMTGLIVALYSDRLISRASLTQMMTPQKTNEGKSTIYGYGWFVGGPIRQSDGRQEAGHGGELQGFTSALYLVPTEQFGVIVLSNLENRNRPLDFLTLARDLHDAVSSH